MFLGATEALRRRRSPWTEACRRTASGSTLARRGARGEVTRRKRRIAWRGGGGGVAVRPSPGSREIKWILDRSRPGVGTAEFRARQAGNALELRCETRRTPWSFVRVRAGTTRPGVPAVQEMIWKRLYAPIAKRENQHFPSGGLARVAGVPHTGSGSIAAVFAARESPVKGKKGGPCGVRGHAHRCEQIGVAAG